MNEENFKKIHEFWTNFSKNWNVIIPCFQIPKLDRDRPVKYLYIITVWKVEWKKIQIWKNLKKKLQNGLKDEKINDGLYLEN